MTRFIIEWLNLAVRYAIPIVAESLFNLRLAVYCTPLESTVEPCAAHAVDGCVSDHADYFSCLSGTHCVPPFTTSGLSYVSNNLHVAFIS